jgi:hypothetical protein
MCLQGFGEEIEVKTPLGRPRRRCEDNIKWNFKKYNGDLWIELIFFIIGTDGGRL